MWRPLEFAVYFRSRRPPSVAAWQAALDAARVPITVADDFDFSRTEGFAEADYDGFVVDFEFTLGDPEADRPAEAREAESVAVFKPDLESDSVNATVMLAAAFAVATDGWMVNSISGELSAGPDAVAYARWFASQSDADDA